MIRSSSKCCSFVTSVAEYGPYFNLWSVGTGGQAARAVAGDAGEAIRAMAQQQGQQKLLLNLDDIY